MHFVFHHSFFLLARQRGMVSLDHFILLDFVLCVLESSFGLWIWILVLDVGCLFRAGFFFFSFDIGLLLRYELVLMDELFFV